MFDSLRDDFYRVKKETGIEKAFELSPIYLLSGQTGLEYIRYWLDKFRCDLEENGGMLKSSTIVPLSLSYNSKLSELGLFYESGEFKDSLDKWLSFVLARYHVECGMVLIEIPRVDDVLHDYIFFQQLLNDIKKHKKTFLFFILSNEIEKIEPFLSTEMLSIYYNVSNSTTDDFVNWVIKEIEENNMSISDADRSILKMMFDKYENNVTLKMIEVWIKTLLWNYYISKNDDGCFLLPESSEALLVEIIEKNCVRRQKLKIGFL